MPAESEAQRRAAGTALAVKRGERSASSLRGASRQMLRMTRSQLEDYARKPQGPQTTTKAAGLVKEHKAMAKRAKPKAHRKSSRSKPSHKSSKGGRR